MLALSGVGLPVMNCHWFRSLLSLEPPPVNLLVSGSASWTTPVCAKEMPPRAKWERKIHGVPVIGETRRPIAINGVAIELEQAHVVDGERRRHAHDEGDGQGQRHFGDSLLRLHDFILPSLCS